MVSRFSGLAAQATRGIVAETFYKLGYTLLKTTLFLGT